MCEPLDILVPCGACDGSGREYQLVWTYERGCGFPHEDEADGGPCEYCVGTGAEPGQPIEEEDLWECEA